MMEKQDLEELALYRAIVEDQTEFIVRSAPDGTLLFVNDSYCRYFGRDRDELIGRAFLPLVHPDDEQMVRDKIASLTPERPVATGEQRVIRGDGRVGWNEWTDRAIFDERGNRTALQSVGRDITARKQVEITLDENQKRYRNRYEKAPVMLHATDPSGRILAVSDRWLEQLGYSRKEVLGRRTFEFLTEDTRRKVQSLGLPTTLLEGQVLDSEPSQMVTKDGRILDTEVSALVEHDADGQFLVLHFVTRDVTARKEAERQREAAFEEIARLKRELELERDYLREEVLATVNDGEIIGPSAAMGQVLARIEAVAPTHAAVLVTGESGVGKELVARAIHQRSLRVSEPMVKVNCASIPRDLFESEFFGHVRGAFTGATRDRVGRFELADGGTIFLDEVGEIPGELQAKLLRVLQEGELERVGETRTRSVDVRVVAATNRDLRAEVQAGRFREDLYYRLGVFPLEIPPLRERREDIVPLASHFLGLACRDFGREGLALTRAQARELERYDWPGNARELSNVVERAVILSPERRLRLDLALPDLEALGADAAGAAEVPLEDDEAPGYLTEPELRDRERENLRAVLKAAGGRVSGPGGAAELLGVKPSTFSYRMKSFGLK